MSDSDLDTCHPRIALNTPTPRRFLCLVIEWWDWSRPCDAAGVRLLGDRLPAKCLGADAGTPPLGRRLDLPYHMRVLMHHPTG